MTSRKKNPRKGGSHFSLSWITKMSVVTLKRSIFSFLIQMDSWHFSGLNHSHYGNISLRLPLKDLASRVTAEPDNAFLSVSIYGILIQFLWLSTEGGRRKSRRKEGGRGGQKTGIQWTPVFTAAEERPNSGPPRLLLSNRPQIICPLHHIQSTTRGLHLLKDAIPAAAVCVPDFIYELPSWQKGRLNHAGKSDHRVCHWTRNEDSVPLGWTNQQNFFLMGENVAGEEISAPSASLWGFSRGMPEASGLSHKRHEEDVEAQS